MVPSLDRCGLHSHRDAARREVTTQDAGFLFQRWADAGPDCYLILEFFSAAFGFGLGSRSEHSAKSSDLCGVYPKPTLPLRNRGILRRTLARCPLTSAAWHPSGEPYGDIERGQAHHFSRDRS